MAWLGLYCFSVTHNILFSQACRNLRAVAVCKPNSSDLERPSEQATALHADLTPCELGAHKPEGISPQSTGRNALAQPG